jgi:hypothetical protein
MACTAKLLEFEEADKAYYDALHEDDYRIQDEIKDPMDFMSTTNEYTM